MPAYELDDDDARAPRRDTPMLLDVLRKVGFMNHLRLDEMEILLDRLEKRLVVKGTVLIRQGDTDAHEFFILMRGNCTVWVHAGGADIKVADIAPGSFFGERALINQAPRAATVKAESLCEVYALSKEAFDAALMHNPDIAESMRLQIARYERDEKG
jgi:CRP-like cAMP-binding protein